MRSVIFANGVLTDAATLRGVVREGDLVVAADGGSRHCRTLGIIPHAVIGDMDSTDEKELAALEIAGAELIRHPTRKDKTDLELAIDLALERGAREILIFGALGLRWDMSLANVMLLASPALAGVKLTLFDGPHEVTLVRGGGRLEVKGRPGDTLSLIPLGGDAVGVTLTGLEYPLTDHTISTGSTLGISNALAGETAGIGLEDGMLLCVVIHG